MSATEEISNLKKLPLHAEHEASGGKFGAFGAWYVPLYFSSVIDEHNTVRNGAGVFDISHMGEFWVEGADAKKVIDHWIVNDTKKLSNGRALYSPVCRETGGIVDDVIVYQFNEDKFLIVVNAANIDKDFAWFESHLEGKAKLINRSEETALLAVQGPKSPDVISALFGIDLSTLSYYHFMTLDSKWGNIVLAETGYTGEKGYEIFCASEQAIAVWKRLFEVGVPQGLKPIGFGARDTLRLESKFLLYGHDMNDETTPVQAGLNWTVGWEKQDFIGKQALATQKEKGVQKKLIGFEVKDRGIAREGCVIHCAGCTGGIVTSGTHSPTLKKSIGLAYMDVQCAKPGQEIELEIRGKKVKGEIVKTPFYRRKK